MKHFKKYKYPALGEFKAVKWDVDNLLTNCYPVAILSSQGSYINQEIEIGLVKPYPAELNISAKILAVSFAANPGFNAVSEIPDTTLEWLWSGFPFSFHVLINGAER